MVGLYVEADRRERALAAVIDERVRSAVRQGESTVVGKGETLAAYSKRWLASREGRVNTIRDNRSALRDHVLPIVGALDVATFTRDDVENVRDALDAKIASKALTWKSARNVWAVFTKLCDDAVNVKQRALRVRKDNPAVGVKIRTALLPTRPCSGRFASKRASHRDRGARFSRRQGDEETRVTLRAGPRRRRES
jgi:hypothetical protein